MKISVENFKAIKELEEFSLKPLNVISGTNSCGKSSFIQLLLLIKQSVENSNNYSLVLNKDYIRLGKFRNIIFGNNTSKFLKIKIYFDTNELYTLPSAIRRNRLYKASLEGVWIEMDFSYKSDKIYNEKFCVIYHFEERKLWLNCSRIRGKKYKMETNTPYFLYDQYEPGKRDGTSQLFSGIERTLEGSIEFESLFPSEITMTASDEFFKFSPLMNTVKSTMKRHFRNMSYLGPLRDIPHTYYLNDKDQKENIGVKGEYAAHLLAEHASDRIVNYRIIHEENDCIRYERHTESLETAVKYWMCDVFKMAKNIDVKKQLGGTIYSVEITNNANLKVPINHVGFGISQILPIVVEGLRMDEKYLLILEQPEIHLHPKVQSLLFDFLYSLTLAEKKIIIETHSDHFITRFRRRVVEDTNEKVSSAVNLVFIEENEEHNEFKVLDLDEYGALSYWPNNFFDQLDKDYRAIVKAQSRKRKQKYQGGNIN